MRGDIGSDYYHSPISRQSFNNMMRELCNAPILSTQLAYIVDIYQLYIPKNSGLDFFLVSDLFIVLYDVIYLWCWVKRLRCALTREGN